MRAFVISGPREASVQEVPEPEAGPGHVVVEVVRAGVCGTDVEFFTGTMPYLRDGHASYPIRIGHEWCGRVAVLGAGVDPSWAGVFVTGDTMLGCGRCDRCRSGRHHVCEERYEVGVRRGWHGALAERLLVPAGALMRLPDDLAPTTAALVEPGGSAVRAVEAAGVAAGGSLCVWGAGTLGLLALQVAVSGGVMVDVVDPRPASRALASELGARKALSPDEPLPWGYEAMIDMSVGPEVPSIAVERVEPAGRVVLVGLAPSPSLLDTRRAVLRDVTVIGILAASAGLGRAVELLADGRIRVEPLVAATVGLDEVADVLGGHVASPSGAPKFLVDPAR
jgi:2-desacetyl-2-hydroxyethyl bacteriochlorophyllide A dehydrogenase